ncbi:regulatory protein YcgZ [Pantoea sp. KPR_PJ]|uniref:regulatory protein YcgZ n=1 Tax=Pantoea sp. KPR_PJ TaxID=2738375 RepID=UPI003527EFC6
MRQNDTTSTTSSDIAQYFNKAVLPTEQETLGQIVVEILRAGDALNRKTLCAKLLTRLEQATHPEEQQHYQKLIGLLFGR